MINSMTAYANGEKTADELVVTVDIRSYNSRHIDIFLRIPPAYKSLEEKIKGLIGDRVARGRVEVRIQIDDYADEAAGLEIDHARAKALVAAYNELKSELSNLAKNQRERIQKEDLVRFQIIYKIKNSASLLKKCAAKSL